MGDLAPPLNCRLVTSSTGEPPSPSPRSKRRLTAIFDASSEAVAKTDNNNNSDAEALITSHCKEDIKAIAKPKDIPRNDNNNNQTTCGSYGSTVVYGPCDTTLTASDDDHNNTTTNVMEDEEDEDSFIVVESKKSKAKGKLSVAPTVSTSAAKSWKDASTKDQSTTLKTPSSTAASVPAESQRCSQRQRDDVVTSTENGSFSAFYQSFLEKITTFRPSRFQIY